MLSFHPITLRDKAWIDRITAAENSRSADFNFGNMYVWDKTYRQYVTQYGERVLTMLLYEEHPLFAYPVGSGELRPAIEALAEYAEKGGYPLRICGITEEQKTLLERACPGQFDYTEDTDGADYIYPAEHLASYSGKALHGKKNHCNRFEAEHDWHFEELTAGLIPDCEELLSAWLRENGERLDESIVYERDAIECTFRHYGELDMEGGVLYADGAAVGFSVGEMANSDTFDVHFEKAVVSINGAYPMVCRELTRMLMRKHPGLVYINREEDMGLPALRESKLSYKPEYLLKKYAALRRE